MIAGTTWQRAPGESGLPGIGSLFPYLRDSLGYLERLRRRHGDVAAYRIGPRRFLLVSHPDDVHAVLQTNASNYAKATNLASVFGQGLLTTEGETWRVQRKLIQPIFHADRWPAVVPVMRAAAKTAVQELRSAGRGTLDIEPIMMRLAFEVVGKALFGADIMRDHAELHAAMESINRILMERLHAVVRIPEWAPTPNNLGFQRAIASLDRIVHGMIGHKRRHPDPSATTVVEQLLRAPGMDDLQIRDHAVTLLLAGHETTAHALSFAIGLLAGAPAIQMRVGDELDELGGDVVDPKQLAALPLLGRCVDEALRLYPPAWGWIRRAVADDHLRGTAVEAGTIVRICPYITHRHPGFWTEPERFDPDRFLPERAEPSHRFAYFPFGVGARSCIGKHFALTEIKLALASLLREFEFEMASPFTLQPRITLGTRGGVRVRVLRR